MLDHLAGKTPEKSIQVAVEIVTAQNVKAKLPEISQTVFAGDVH